jgi:predicted TPR repeat methyltransferase
MSETPSTADARSSASADTRGSGDVIADRRYLFAQALLGEGDAAGAADLARQVLERVPRWAPAWLLLAEAEDRAGEPGAAADACRRALALDPQDRLGAGLRLALLGGSEAPPRGMSPAYVAALFDDYAPRFERHLTEDLAYRGPQQLVDMLDRLGAGPFARVLDLGCGTGLMAAALGDRAGRIEGCDIAPAMAARSRAAGRYARVEAAEALDFLARCEPGSADLVTAADVVVYVGDLDPLFRAVGQVLRPGGLFALTIQTGPGEGFARGEDLRFRHAPSYVREVGAARGLPVLATEDVVLRTDRGRPVSAAAMACRREGP